MLDKPEKYALIGIIILFLFVSSSCLPVSQNEMVQNGSEIPVMVESPSQSTATRSVIIITPTLTVTAVPQSEQETKSTESSLNEPSVSSVEEINFLMGGTMALVKGYTRGDESQKYQFSVSAGQEMILDVSSNMQSVFMELRSVDDGSLLVSASDRLSSWRGISSQTQTYELKLISDTPDSYYLVSLEIPANIILENGSTSRTVYGHFETLQEFFPDIPTRIRYLFEVEAGKKLSIQLSGDDVENLSLSVTGQTDGQPYARYQVKSSSFEMVMPISQGYYIDVYPFAGGSGDFSLFISIE